MLKLINLTKSFTEADQKTYIFENLNLDLKTNSPIILLGSSGSGKTTLLNLISGIDQPDSGQIIIAETVLSQDENKKTVFRKENLGFVFQFYNLIPTLNIEDNILLPLELTHKNTKENREYVINLLDKVGLKHRLKSFPDMLSGGEQQRVSLVRALAHKPKVLIADEPTGNLDKTNSEKINLLMRDLCKMNAVQLIMATHNPDLIEDGDAVLEITNKQISIKNDSNQI
jgi:putative ABC transport system ATP-binding protein